MKFKILMSLLICGFIVSQAQEGLPIYQDYLTGSWYLIHPSTAGAASADQVRITARTQWFDVDDAPSLFAASLNARLGRNIGIGGVVFSDKNGDFSQNGVSGTFAYHINMNARSYELNQLSFGISFAALQRKLDETDLFNPRVVDPAISGGVLSDTYFNSDFGISYYKGDLFALFTVKNAIPIRKDNILLERGFEPNDQSTYLVAVGYTFNAARDFDLEPSIMYITIPELKEQLADINLKAYYELNENSNIFGGLSYRFNFDGTETSIDNVSIDLQRFNAITPFFGVNHKNFIFSYTYTNQINEVKISNSGFHQITLGYNFKGKRNLRGGLRECNCPAFK